MAIFKDDESMKDIFDLIEKFEKSNLFHLEITIPPEPPAPPQGTTIKMMKLSQYAPEGPVKVTVGNADGTESIKLQRNEFNSVKQTEPEESSDSGGKIITAPLIGTFYLSPSPEAEPYAKVGDKINQGEVVCIIEAMKTMNEIESEFDGEITAVLVKNGSPVEYGQPLFKLK